MGRPRVLFERDLGGALRVEGVHRQLQDRGGRHGGAPGRRRRARIQARRRATAGRAQMSRTFALLGSGEFEDWTDAVDRWLLDRAGGDGTVLISPLASALEGEHIFEDWAAKGLAH